MTTLKTLNPWKALAEHAKALNLSSRPAIKQSTQERQQQFQASSSHIHLHYSNQHITQKTLDLLFSLAEHYSLREKIQALMRGDKVNRSENKPALHTALRASDDTRIWVDSENIMTMVIATRNKMQQISEKIRNKQWLGYLGTPITDIVNIGIGGSDLGPRFCIQALADYKMAGLGFHFVSDVDPNSFTNAVSTLNPATTLFIVASKSFTTKETLYNTQKAIAWLGAPNHIKQQMIAITANPEKATHLGIETTLPIWEWVGGRYSLCSAINLITAIAIGFDAFNQLLAGANSMDEHFLTCDFASNLPVLMALIGVWNNNVLHIHNLLVLSYTQQLEQLVPFIQQLDMESNGKSTDNQGRAVDYHTGPIVWGGLGNQAQHSYYQLLCQGTHKVCADFISMRDFNGQIINTMCDAKIQVLTGGVHDQENPYAHIPGNVPLNHIQIENCSPFTIGALVSLYEHKIFTQSVIWDINPFDQPGIDSAKKHPAFAV